jgi:nucleoside-diphosphate-sugar epimerase
MPGNGLIFALASQLLRGKPATLRNAGCYGGDFVFVDDVVNAIAAALESPIEGPVNIGLGRRVLIDEIGRTLAEICSAPPDLVRLEPPGDAPDPGYAALDISRARTALRLNPTPLREGLEKYVASLAAL